MLIAIVAAVVAMIFALTFWSLQRGMRLPMAPTELHNVDRVTRADGLDQLPQDYSKLPQAKPEEKESSVPVLGNPLPGDLGMAMLPSERANNTVQGLGASALPDPAREAARVERANRDREAEDAAKAPLFFRTANRKDGNTATASNDYATLPSAAEEAKRTEHSKNDKQAPQTSTQAQTSEFLSRTTTAKSVSRYGVESPVSPYQVMAGTVISAALITGINSDLPGTVLATVTEPVYDTSIGRYVLIPQGTRLIGEYDSQVAFGQRRVLLVWNRMVFPDGSSLTLDRLAGVDAAGNAGLEDGVDRHWRQLLAGAALSSLIGVAAELAAPDRSTGSGQVVVSARQSVQDSVNQVGQELTRRNLSIQPTLTIRAGYPVRVIVSKDLVLRPYQPSFIKPSSP